MIYTHKYTQIFQRKNVILLKLFTQKYAGQVGTVFVKWYLYLSN